MTTLKLSFQCGSEKQLCNDLPHSVNLWIRYNGSKVLRKCLLYFGMAFLPWFKFADCTFCLKIQIHRRIKFF